MRGLVWLAALACALPGAASAQETRGFREWWAACSEQRTCWAFGFSADGSDQMGLVRVERAGAAGAEPTVILGAGLWDGAEQPATAAMRVSVDGNPWPTLTARTDEESDWRLARVTDPKAARALIAALRNGARMTLQLEGWKEPAVVSLNGGAAALLWMDDRQKRAGTVTALARPGPKPASAVPPVPPRRVVRAAPAVAQGREVRTWPAAVAARPEVKSCLEEMSSDELRAPEAARLDARTVLWGVPCSQGAYQTSYRFFLADAQGRGWRPAPFEPAPPEGEETWVTAAGFDAASMTLSGFHKGRGIADCGTGSAWTWTGRAFVLTWEQTMGECRGVPISLWPVTVDADVRR